jgi:hypothetical protein
MIKKSRYSIAVFDAPRQNDRFEGVNEHDDNQRRGNDRPDPTHSEVPFQRTIVVDARDDVRGESVAEDLSLIGIASSSPAGGSPTT